MVEPKWWVLWSAATALALGVAVTAAAPSRAQDAGGDIWGKGGCSSCHGNVADGGDDPANPIGPSLRRTRLDKDQLKETIACGRPGTGMPYNLAGAYTQAPCYGLPVGAVPPETMRGANFTPQELDALTAFLMANVVGQTRITRQNCAALFGGNLNSPACAQYR